MTSNRLAALLVVATLAFACRDPIRDGCRFATGLNASCKPGDGEWTDVQGEPFKTKLPVTPLMLAGETENPETEEFNSNLRALSLVEKTKRSIVPGDLVDSVEKLVLRRFVLMYPDRGTVNDCIKSSERERALAIMLRRDESGYVYLNRGPISAMNSSLFESDYVSAKIRAQIEAKFAEQVKDPAKLSAAVDAAFSLVTKNVRSDFVAGHYRSLSLRSHQQLWEELVCAKVVRDDCMDGRALASLGLAVATLASRDTLSDSALGSNFDAELKAALGGDEALASVLKASAKAVLNLAIETTSKERLKVSLETPALVPLTWKPDTFRLVTQSCQPPQSCTVSASNSSIAIGTKGELGQCHFRPGARVTVKIEGKVQLDGFAIDADTWIAYTFSAGDKVAPKFDHQTKANPVPPGPPGYSGVKGHRVISQSLEHVAVPTDGVVRAWLFNDFTHTNGPVRVVDGLLTMTEEALR